MHKARHTRYFFSNRVVIDVIKLLDHETVDAPSMKWLPQ